MSSQPATGLRLALELTEIGDRVRKQRFGRGQPMDDEQAVRRFMDSWWRARPGAPCGDSIGHSQGW